MSDPGFVCTDLTVPSQGSQTVRTLFSRYLGRQYRDFLKLRLAGATHEALALGALQRHCRGLATTSPGPLFSALQHTTVGGLIRYLADGAIASPEGLRWTGHLVASLYAELALGGAAPPPILVPAPLSRLIVGGVGVCIQFPDRTSTLRLHPDGLTLAGPTGVTTLTWDDVRRGDSPLIVPAVVPLKGRCTFALVDDSPVAQFETHPDKSGNGLDLGGRTSAEWVASLQEALDLVRLGVPAIADEIELLIEQVIPVGYDRERHLSASYAEYVGTIYLSLHPDSLTLAEALIHEHSHNKINMLWTLAPVLHNAFTPLYTSPFRPDPRPLHGVLLGVHAFLPIEGMYEELLARDHPAIRGSGFEERRRRVRERNAQACEMLDSHAQPTDTGRGVLDEIVRWNAHYSSASVLLHG